MEQVTLTCQAQRRREAVRHQGRNGIDYVEIVNREQTELRVHLFREAPPREEIAALIEGGRRIRNIQVKDVSPDHDAEDCLRLSVDRRGDFSPYTLRIVALKEGRPTNQPPPGFDPRYAKIQFSFKLDCPSDLDCKRESLCPLEKRAEPEINYLAKDYASFRRLILDRLALIMPGWQERHVPDVGIALVEVLAYVGDHLSYYQDAVATEAYLETARQRISVRRHARLVDYHLHEGCNARAWISLETDQNVIDSPVKWRDIYFTSGSEAEVFEPVLEDADAPLELYAAHSKINFYTWGDDECCLPRGATAATLKDKRAAGENERSGQLNLKVGDILIFEEVKGPKTGNEADKDPARRWAVRLTKVESGEDPLYEQPIVEIEWAEEDSLPFSFCISARLPAPECTLIHDISVARGNVILVDHGRTIDPPEPLGQVGEKWIVGQCECEGSAVDITHVPDLFRPVLKQGPLTFSEPHVARTSAAVFLTQDPRQALPQITLSTGEPDKPHWHPQHDLLGSGSQDRDFVVEIDNDGGAHLRFADGELGRLPDAGMIFTSRYRVGNGPAGNVGADTITKVVFRQNVSGLALQVRNPLPAQGGTAPEPVAEARLLAPGAFRKELHRAITADDYARLAERSVKIQRAGASLRWNGSWYEAQVAVDPRGAGQAEKSLLTEIKRSLERYRRIGHDLRITGARYVPLELALTVCALPHYLRGHIEAALLAVFSNCVLPDGQLGFFHPDNLTFGEGIFVSKLVAAAQAVPGVESATVTKLERYAEGDQGELADGILRLGALEVARLDNDPSFPEHGKLALTIGGGR